MVKDDEKLVDDLVTALVKNIERNSYLGHIESFRLSQQEQIIQITESRAYRLKGLLDNLSLILVSPVAGLKKLINLFEVFSFNDKNLTILEFGCIPWQFRFQRPQHLATELVGKGCRVYYFDPVFDVERESGLRRVRRNLYISNPRAGGKLSIHYHIPSQKDIDIFNDWFEKFRKKNRISSYIIKVDHPFWFYFLGKNRQKIIYDCMDNHSAFENKHEEINYLERSITKRADFVLVSSDGLKDKLSKYNPKRIAVLRNGVEYDLFTKKMAVGKSKYSELEKMKMPILGYYGAICEWFDFDLVSKIAADNAQCSIVIIGRIDSSEAEKLAESHKNVHFLGEKPYIDIPKYLSGFDVCLIPFIINDLIKSTNPVKVYEYFSAGKPVVTTAVPELLKYSDLLYYSRNKAQFVKNVKVALTEKKGSLVEKQRKIQASKNTWGERGETLFKILKSIG